MNPTPGKGARINEAANGNDIAVAYHYICPRLSLHKTFVFFDLADAHEIHDKDYTTNQPNAHIVVTITIMEQAANNSTSNTALVKYQCWKSDQAPTSSWDAGTVEGFPWLLVGSLSAAERVFSSPMKQTSSSLQVTRVLTVARDLPIENQQTAEENIEHLRVDLDDHPNADLWPVLETCLQFVDAAETDYQEQQKRGESDRETATALPAILVHCASGISRSVAIVLAWMLLRQHCPRSVAGPKADPMSLEELLKLVRHERPLANPNWGFWSQLQVLEKHAKLALTTDSNPIASAQADWKTLNREDRLAHISQRRRFANEVHAQVDQFEVAIQQLRAGSQLAPQSVASLISRGAAISDRLDQSTSDTLGIPEDRVTRMIFKSARGKLERFMALLEEDNETRNV